MEISDMGALDPRRQLETLKQNDTHNQLLTFTESLVAKVAELSSQLEVVTGDLEDQNAIRRDWKRRAEIAESAISKNPFILVLIDGDGYLFEDDYLKNAESGGGDAAHRLLSAVQDCVRAAQLQGLSSDSPIMTNIYGNKRGLTGALLEAEIITHPRDLENFFCKFTQSHTHFQYIDCGPGKERADAKLRDTYRFFLHHCQCRLILLALCHDNGYIAELDKYRNDARAAQKTLLIDHYAKGQAFIDPPFPIIKLDDVFSTKPLYVRRTKGSVSLPNQSSYASTLAASPTAGQPPIPRQSSFSRLPPWSKPASGTQSTIATPHQSQQTLMKEPHAPYLALGVDPPISSDQIPINRFNQRLDSPLHPPSPASFRAFESRIAYHKLCNEHYLRGHCSDRNCRFDHSPIDADLENTLRYTARKIVCRSGTACRRADCYYGHQCPFASCDVRRCPFAKAGLHDVDGWEIVGFVSAVG